MTSTLDPRETVLALTLAAIALAAALLPPLAQPAGYHAFADQRSLAGIPNALDVLTNLPFALWGIAGLRRLTRLPRAAIHPGSRHAAQLFFAGLVATAAGSAWYHLAPDAAGLAVDRAGMAPAFAGLMALAAGDRVSARAAAVLAPLACAAGWLAVAVWAATANVLPWAAFQYGGMLLVAAACLLQRAPCGLAVAWPALLVLYALAKLLETQDAAVFALTGGWVSGHSLKHVVAALAAWPVWHALATPADTVRPRHRPLAA